MRCAYGRIGQNILKPAGIVSAITVLDNSKLPFRIVQKDIANARQF